MAQVTNDTRISHTCRHGCLFTAETADLRNGVTIDTSGFLSASGSLAADCAEFGAWHAMKIHPHLKGFSGYDCVTFHFLKDKD